MPEPTPSHDDPFADLFGRLPDPRTRTGENPAAPTTGAIPLSRRAAREAAAAAATGAIPVVSASSEAPAEQPSPLRSTPLRASAAPVPHEDEPEPEPVDDGLEPALPYARTGSTPPRGTPAVEASALAQDSARPSSRTTGSLDDLFSGRSTSDDLGAPPPPPDKRKRRIGGWIALGIVLLFLGGIAAGTWYVWTTYEAQIREFMGWEEPKDYEDGLANGEVFVTIIDGDTGQSISRTLFDAGVTKTPEAFYEYLVDTGQNPPFVPGVFKLQQQMTSQAALEAIMDPANKQEHTAQLREGLTVAQSLEILSQSLGIPLAELQAAAADPTSHGVTPDPAIVAAGGHPLEGWLFPATYTFDPGVSAQGVIDALVVRTLQSLDSAGVPPEERHRILTIASIIQREARFEEDFYKVSRVIQNRLDPANQETFGLLQMDSTAQFGYGEMHDGTVSSSAEALADPNPWNTYVHPGLPIGPIANPGDLAIDAAMHPADGPWLYFVTVNMDTGETVFTTNLADHNRAAEQWRAWCKDHPDSGC